MIILVAPLAKNYVINGWLKPNQRAKIDPIDDALDKQNGNNCLVETIQMFHFFSIADKKEYIYFMQCIRRN